MTDIDTSLVTELNIGFVEADGTVDSRTLSVTPKRHSWRRRLLEIIEELAWDGAVPGSGAAMDYRVLSATARIKSGAEVDVLEQLLREGWADWLERDRRGEPYRLRHSTAERDDRVRARQIMADTEIGLTDRYGLLRSTPEHEAAGALLEAACVVEDAAVARVAATWREPVVVEPIVTELVTAVQQPPYAPAPANDTTAYDHATLLRRAHAARDAAEAEERRTLGAFLAAQEVRRQAQADLDEVLATAELYSAPALVEADADWDPRLGPDADEDAAEAKAHAEFIATLNQLEADDRLKDAIGATDAAAAELWSAVSRAETAVGTEVVSEISAACRLVWTAHQAERLASDVYDRAHDGVDRLAA